MKDVDNSSKTILIQTAFRCPKTLHMELKKIALREERDMQDIIQEQIENYVKVHGSGNPIYPLDNWKDPDFKLCPAFFHSSKTIHDYFLKCKDDEFSTHKFKLSEWIHAFKQRYGDSP